MKENVEDELREISPFLMNLEKKEGFQVPQNYFREFQDVMMARLKADSLTGVRPASRWQRLWDSLGHNILQPRVAVAFASIVFVASLGLWLYQNQVETAPVALTQEEIQSYINDNLDEFDETQIIEQRIGDVVEEKLDDKAIPDEAINKYLEDNLPDMDEKDLEELL